MTGQKLTYKTKLHSIKQNTFLTFGTIHQGLKHNHFLHNKSWKQPFKINQSE